MNSLSNLNCKQKKIAIISPGGLPLPSIKGGAVEGLIDTIINYNEDNNLYDLEIFSIYDEEARVISSRYNNSTFNYIKMNRTLHLFAMKRLIPLRWYYRLYCHYCIKKLKKSNIDIVIIQNEFIYANIIRKRIKSIPLILHLHNDYINATSQANVMDNIDGIICVSNYIKNRVREIDTSIDIKTVYNGTDLTLFKPNEYKKEITREKYGLKKDDLVIVYAGRLIKEKGILELISAINLMNPSNIKLLVCGSSGFKGSGETSYTKKIKEEAKKSKGKVVFTGFVSHDELPYLYQSADIGCIPSIFEEPFGLTVIEQMASGLPVVVSDAGAIPEIVNQDSAIIVKRSENYIYNIKTALEKLCTDHNLRKNMGLKARERAEFFSKNDYCKNFFEVVNDFFDKQV